MKVHVDESRCQGHTLCAMLAPDVFELSDVDGHATATTEDVPGHLRADVIEASGSCPEQAIIVDERSTKSELGERH